MWVKFNWALSSQTGSARELCGVTGVRCQVSDPAEGGMSGFQSPAEPWVSGVRCQVSGQVRSLAVSAATAAASGLPQGHYHYRNMASTIPKASVQIQFVRLRPMEV